MKMRMKRFNKTPFWLLVLLVLIPVLTWAGPTSVKEDDSFPKPYINQDKGINLPRCSGPLLPNYNLVLQLDDAAREPSK